jgi:hypothetical protein
MTRTTLTALVIALGLAACSNGTDADAPDPDALDPRVMRYCEKGGITDPEECALINSNDYLQCTHDEWHYTVRRRRLTIDLACWGGGAEYYKEFNLLDRPDAWPEYKCEITPVVDDTSVVLTFSIDSDGVPHGYSLVPQVVPGFIFAEGECSKDVF